MRSVYTSFSTAVTSCSSIKGTPLRSGRVTHLIYRKPIFSCYQRIWCITFCGTLICPLPIWQFGLKLELSVEVRKALQT